jgi:hypothetical protein
VSARSPGRLPVKLSFVAEDGRADAWGRLAWLSAAGAEIETLAALSPGERVLLSFEVNGETFESARARVDHAQTDSDGFCSAELLFEDPLDKRRLAKTLLDALSR